MKNQKRKIMYGINGLWLCVFSYMKRQTLLPIYQGDNLIGGRIDDFIKSGRYLT